MEVVGRRTSPGLAREAVTRSVRRRRSTARSSRVEATCRRFLRHSATSCLELSV